MIRICTALAGAGYAVTLVGRLTQDSLPLQPQPFHQHRLHCYFQKGKLFYAEYNLRLFFYLLFIQTDLIGSIDLDSILPGYWASVLRRKQRLYDAHELFCEMKEIVTRPAVYRFWKRIERYTVPKFPLGYTVNQPIAEAFEQMYGVRYAVIRNMPFRDSLPPIPAADKKERYFLYQGAVNEGRSFETLIPAFRQVNAPLWICGEGNFMEQARALVKQYKLEDKVIFKGKLRPAELKPITRGAWAGITLFDAEGQSNYYSLANRYFDYIQAGIPQLCVDFPVYRELNNLHAVAVLTQDLQPDVLARHLNTLLNDQQLYDQLQQATYAAREEWNWEAEQEKLLTFFTSHFR